MKLLPLLSGDMGTFVTIGQMKGMVKNEFLSPTVRLTASNIVAGLGGRDGLEQAVAIRNWLADHTEFLRDPDETEMLHGPIWQIKQVLTYGTVRVDCDDIAMLAAALGKSIGLRARFVVVGFVSPDQPFRHVWTELSSPVSPTGWVDMDVTRPAQSLPFNAIARQVSIDV